MLQVQAKVLDLLLSLRFNGHPPLGVNATVLRGYTNAPYAEVSMGTHPWG